MKDKGVCEGQAVNDGQDCKTRRRQYVKDTAVSEGCKYKTGLST